MKGGAIRLDPLPQHSRRTAVPLDRIARPGWRFGLSADTQRTVVAVSHGGLTSCAKRPE